MRKTTYEQIEKTAKMYSSNTYAAEALGITPPSFGRLCRQYKIETPNQRKKRQKREAKTA